jgi:DNA modification methylase
MTTSTTSWVESAFFDDPEGEPIDGGETSHGPLWHAVSPRWGHSMHPMCSYHGMFPAKIAHYFIQRYSREDDLIFDPFSGRGTTPLQARVEGRRTVANDLSPLAYVLSRAKAAPPSWDATIRKVADLEHSYRRRDVTIDVHPDIEMLYHENTLRQLVYLRRYLFRRPVSAWSRVDYMIAGATAGILHGAHRRDGTSQYLSISMPNTFSMSPGYVEKFIRDNDLVRIDQDVFERLRDKLARLYLDGLEGLAGSVTNRDANALMSSRIMRPSSVDLLLTSPPYLNVVNYGTSNWIRLWWLGLDDVARDSGVGRRKLNAKLDHRHSYDSYVDFMRRTFTGTRRVLSKTGVAVFVIGDVATPGGEARPLAQEVWDAVGAETGLRLLDVIEDSLPAHKKVSRIWGETKGNATDRDCVLVLGRDDGEPRTDVADVQWIEPYKDAGPDAAHARFRRSR